MPFEHHVGAADCVGLFVELLAVDLEPRCRIERAQVVLGNGQHAPGATRRVEDGSDDARLGEHVGVLGEQQVDHQSNDFAGSEVLTRRLVGELGEPTDELLVEVAHLEVRHLVWVEIDLGELGHDQVEQVGPVEPGDLGVEVELVEDVSGPGRESRDVGPEVGGQLGRIVQDRGEVKWMDVVELLFGYGAQNWLDVLDGALDPGEPFDHLRLGGGQHAVEAPEHCQREDDLSILGLLVVTAQEVGHRPDERCMCLDCRCIAHLAARDAPPR